MVRDTAQWTLASSPGRDRLSIARRIAAACAALFHAPTPIRVLFPMTGRRHADLTDAGDVFAVPTHASRKDPHHG